MRIFPVISLPLFLVACGETPEPQSITSAREFVPIAQVIAETRNMPHECSGYDPASNSCTSISRMTQSGNSVVNVAHALVSTNSPVTVKFSERLRIEEGKACGNPGSSQLELIGETNPARGEFVKNVTLKAMRLLGEVCYAYYRDGEVGQYRLVRQPADGRSGRSKTHRVRFFADSKTLRYGAI